MTLNDARAIDFTSQPDLSNKVEGGTPITATWHFINSGTESWTPDYEFVHIVRPHARTHSRMGAEASFSLAQLGVVEAIAPQATVALSLDMQAPDEAGDYISQWQLRTSSGELFGPVRWVSVGVEAVEQVAFVAPPANVQMGMKPIGMTLSHFEFDLDQIDDVGMLATVPVRGSGLNFRDVIGRFDVLRFMNWQKTNANPIWEDGKRDFHLPPRNRQELIKWNRRPTWRDLIEEKAVPFRGAWETTWGVPLHVCLEVAKQSGTHPWLSIPHGESLEAFTGLMHEIVDTTLAALQGTGLKPIFEFSNEIWNQGRFDQFKECVALANNTPAFNTTRFGFDQRVALAWQVARTNDIKNYVGDRAWVVIGSQANNPWISLQLLAQQETEGGELLSPAVDALAVAPYYGNERVKQWAPKDILPHGFHPLIDPATGQRFNLDDANIMQKLHENLLVYVCGKQAADGRQIGGETCRTLPQHRRHIDAFNTRHNADMRLWSYEGGLDLHYPNGDNLPDGSRYGEFDRRKVRDLYRAYARSPLAGEVVKQVFEAWYAPDVRGDLFCGYSSATNFAGDDLFGHLDIAAGHYTMTGRMSQLLAGKL